MKRMVLFAVTFGVVTTVRAAIPQAVFCERGKKAETTIV